MMELPEGLIQLPEGVLKRALAAIAPRTGVEPLTELVVEALTRLLDDRGVQAKEGETPARSSPEMNLSFAQIEFSNAAAVPRQLAPEATGPRGGWSDKGQVRITPLATREGSIDLDLGGPAGESFGQANTEITRFEELLDDSPSGDSATRIIEMISSWSAIEPVDCQPVPSDGEIRPPERQKPLFGFHNRDFPSLWGLGLLATATPEEPILWSEFALALDLLSQRFGGLLRALDQMRSADGRSRGELRYATSFPKPGTGGGTAGGQWLLSPEGERVAHLSPFVKNNFARIQKAGNKVQAAGPLPQWGAIAFFPEGRDYRVGLTKKGIALLEATAGSSIELPHPPEAARAFFDYLKGNSPEDWQGFERVLGAIVLEPNREELVRSNKEFFDSFRETATSPEDIRFASTMTQGYVSRGREWGLIAPDLAPSEQGKRVLYQLTELGEQLASSSDWA